MPRWLSWRLPSYLRDSKSNRGQQIHTLASLQLWRIITASDRAAWFPWLFWSLIFGLSWIPPDDGICHSGYSLYSQIFSIKTVWTFFTGSNVQGWKQEAPRNHSHYLAICRDGDSASPWVHGIQVLLRGQPWTRYCSWWESILQSLSCCAVTYTPGSPAAMMLLGLWSEKYASLTDSLQRASW